MSVAIPKVSNISANAIPDNGNDSTSSGMTIGVDTLTLSSKKEVADYIYDTSMDSAVNLKDAFFQSAPGVFLEDMEATIFAELIGASASNPDHRLQMSGASNAVPTIADIRLAAKLLDIQKYPQGDRYLAVSPAIKSAILSFTELTSAATWGNSQPLQNGVIGEILGFKVIMSNQVTATSCVAYHKSSLAFAFQKNVTAVDVRQEEKARGFVALRAHYGVKTLNSGKGAVLLNTTGA